MNALSPTSHLAVRSSALRAAQRLMRPTHGPGVPPRAPAPAAPGLGQAAAPPTNQQLIRALTSQAADAAVTVRPAQPSDVGPLQQLYASLSSRTRAQRFFSPLRELPREMLAAIETGQPAHRFLVVERAERDGYANLLGLGQSAVEPGQARCELALLIADDWQGCGLGTRLLGELLKDAVAAGLREARLETLHGNLAMQALARRAGFSLRTHPEDALLLLGSRTLAGQAADASVGVSPVAATQQT